ncbi:MAG TPA: phosphotransferase [Roseiflexaceae bacterium]|nr:phosphotransferase [Roseiflexaceae bacterium]
MSTTVEPLGRRVTDVLAGLRTFVTPDWLAVAAQTDRVIEALKRHVPEFATGQLTLQECAIKRVRLRDGSGYWTGTYRLTVTGLQPGRDQVVAVRARLIPPGWKGASSAERRVPAAPDEAAPFGAERWRCSVPELRLELETQPPEAELPALPVLTDPEEARLLIERAMRESGPAYADVRIRSCVPQVMRYKPGSRCTIRYRLEYPAELAAGREWPTIVVAKTYRSDKSENKGQNAFAAMRALWDSPLGRSRAVAIAEPLAYLPELNMLLQGPIREETTLKDLIRAALRADTMETIAELHDYMRKTAIGLAELHRCGVRYGETVTWHDEFEEVRQRYERLTIPIPQLAGLAAPLLARLDSLAAAHPADPPQPAHRSFRPAQVLLHTGQIGFIDFDGFCQAEPAMDLALFMAKVKQTGLSKVDIDEDEADDEVLDEPTRLRRLARMEAACDLFLSTYAAHAPVSRQRVVLWEALDLFALVLGCWTKIKTGRLRDSMLLLERHLRLNGLDMS